jgi:hypothetical protein
MNLTVSMLGMRIVFNRWPEMIFNTHIFFFGSRWFKVLLRKILLAIISLKWSMCIPCLFCISAHFPQYFFDTSCTRLGLCCFLNNKDLQWILCSKLFTAVVCMPLLLAGIGETISCKRSFSASGTSIWWWKCCNPSSSDARW